MAIIGIDLGTTNSLVSVWCESAVELIPNALGEVITPSVISYDEKSDDLLIGKAAKQRLISHPEFSVACFKRAMGTQTEFRLGRKRFNAIELSALLLKQLKADAEAFLNESVNEAVISVPAYFSDTQRNATKQAGELAGLKVDRLINEPTAAALAYGLQNKVEQSLFMVIDLGGGTLDVSILDIFDNIIEVRATAGDNFFGGEDFGLALMDEFARVNDLKVDYLAPLDRAKLATQVEHLKHHLSINHEGEIDVQISGKSYQWAITRKEFERIAEPLIKRFRKPIERALRDSQISVSELENVVMVGGATRMPWVRSEVTKLFQRLPDTRIHPDHVIGLGAGTQAGLKSRDAAFEELVLTDVCPYTLGVSVAISVGRSEHESGHFLPLIERNSTVPISREERLFTLSDNQSSVLCNIYQGESRLVKNNVKIGSVEVPVPKAKAGEEYVDLRFTYDVNGILEVIVTVGSNKTSERTIINHSDSTLSEAEIDASFKKLEGIKIHPRENAKNRELVARLERYYEESLGDQRKYIAEVLREFDLILAKQDPDLAERSRGKFCEIADYIEQQL